jgi:hypothetical protein
VGSRAGFDDESFQDRLATDRTTSIERTVALSGAEPDLIDFMAVSAPLIDEAPDVMA